MLHRTFPALWVLACHVSFSGTLLAAEDAAHGEGESHASPIGTFWNSVTTLITFGLVLYVLGKVVWPRVLKLLKDREDFIRESLQSAKRDREEAEKRLKEYEARLDKARQEATAIVDEGRRDAEVLRRKLHEQAKEEADAILERAKREIQIARDTAVKDLYTFSGDLATELASRIIREKLDAKAHERLIRESIDEITRMERSN